MAIFTSSAASDPVAEWPAVTPSDTTGFSRLPTSIYVEGAGTIAAVDGNGNILSRTCVAGEFLPIRPIRINATGTTATLRALY